MGLIEKYIQRLFLSIFGFCLLGVVIIFLTVDMVENIDQFIDRSVPGDMIFLYYLSYIPYVLVLTMPVATLLATVFSVGTFAKHNEIVAMKALGYSLYQVAGVLLVIGLVLSASSFFLSEGIVIRTNRYKEKIQQEFLDRMSGRESKQLRDIEVQEPPDKIITIGRYDPKKQIAHKVKVETFHAHQLVSRIDAPRMIWDGKAWWIEKGYKRDFEGDHEMARPILDSLQFTFQFKPKELFLAQIKPEEMDIRELYSFIQRVRASGGEVHRFMTDFYLRIAFPLSNLMIVLFGLPLVYNQRKRSLTIGFGISLVITFFYFGVVKLGQTIGQNGGMHPFLAAWLGNGVMGIGGIINLLNTRK